MADLLPLQKRMPLFEDIFRAPSPVISPIRPGVGGVPRALFGDSVPEAPQTPSLFTPEDIKAARANALLQFGSSLLGASGTGRPVGTTPTFASAFGTAAQAGGAGYDAGLQQHAGQRMAMQAQQLRQRIAQQYPEVPGETSEQTIRRLEKIFAALVAGGDTEGAGKIGEVLKSYGGNRVTATQKPTGEWEDFGGEKWLVDPITRRPIIDPATGKPIIQKKTPNARDPNAPDTAEQMRQQRMFGREQQLTDDFNRDTRGIREGAIKLDGALAEVPRAIAGDGASQINILYAFVTAMDPASAVREGEIALARMAAPFWEQAQNFFKKYMSGESVVVPQGLIKNMGELMRRKLDYYRDFTKERSEYYTGRAKRWKLEGADELFPLLSSRAPAAVSSQPAAGTPSPFDNLNGLFPKR